MTVVVIVAVAVFGAVINMIVEEIRQCWVILFEYLVAVRQEHETRSKEEVLFCEGAESMRMWASGRKYGQG